MCLEKCIIIKMIKKILNKIYSKILKIKWKQHDKAFNQTNLKVSKWKIDSFNLFFLAYNSKKVINKKISLFLELLN